MPKVRPPFNNPSDLRKVLHGIHRLEERMIKMEGRMAAGTLRPAPAGSRVINDSSGGGSWIPPLRSTNKQRG
jgi:hypothetical protein